MNKNTAFALANAGIDEQPVTHYVPFFTRERAGQVLTFCGVWVARTDHRVQPTCPDCQRILQQDDYDFAMMAAWSEEMDRAKYQ